MSPERERAYAQALAAIDEALRACAKLKRLVRLLRAAAEVPRG